MAKRLYAVARMVITCGILAFIFFQVEWHRLPALLHSISLPHVAITVLLIFAGTVLAAFAELQIMKAIQLDRSFMSILKINYQSYFYSLLHELIGTAVRYRRFSGNDRRRGEAVFIMGYEKMQMLLLFYLFSLAGYVLSRGLEFGCVERCFMNTLYTALGLAFVICAAILLFRWPGTAAQQLLGRIENNSVAGAIARKCLDIVRIVRQFQMRPRRYLTAFCVYGIGVALGFVVYFFLFRALQVTLPWSALIWTVSFAMLAQALPFTMYGLGLREGALIYCLSKFTVSSEVGITVGLLVFFLNLLPGLVYGVLSFVPHLEGGNGSSA